MEALTKWRDAFQNNEQIDTVAPLKTKAPTKENDGDQG